MTARTGNIYTSETTADSIEIPTANLEFSTTMRSKKVYPEDCDNDRQPEMAI